MRKNSVKLLSLLACLSVSGNLYAETGNVLLWNKIGSADEIANSQAGVNGQVIENVSYAPVQYGSGVAVTSNTGLVSFPQPFGTLFPEQGAVEFWWKPQYAEDYRPSPSHLNERDTVT